MKKIIIILVAIFIYSCSGKKTQEPQIDTSNSTISTPKVKKKGDENLEGYRLISNSDCTSCHKGNAKLIGPSYQEISEKYDIQDSNKLAEIIINGGSGNWGQVPMQSHPNISKQDAKKMVEYILSFKK